MRTVHFFFLFLQTIPIGLLSQEPFVCRGAFYLALSPGGSGNVFEMDIDSLTEEVVFHPIAEEGVRFTINSIGYRSTDNFIYGIDELDFGLYRIGSDGKAEHLSYLSGFDQTLSYPAGDISPDGRYLVLLGGSGDFTVERGSSKALVFIDLESPTYEVRVQPLAENEVRCFDIAFDPQEGDLYGFDGNADRLVRFDPSNGTIFTDFPTDNRGDAMGSVFFDSFGRLYGYGRPFNGQSQNTLFLIDKYSGRVKIVSEGPSVQRSDGCSCPYTVQMEKTVTPVQASTCTEQTFTFTMANASGEPQSGLTLTDTFPEFMTITAIINPLGGRTLSGVGSALLQLTDLTIPLGKSVIQVKVRAKAGVEGWFKNQASLMGLPKSLGSRVLSDDPETLIRNDATAYRIDSLEIDFGLQDSAICTGQTILLNPSIEGVDYLWSDGSTDSILTITQGGTYGVTVSNACEWTTGSLTIVEHVIGMEFPENLTLILGDSIQLKPLIQGLAPFQFYWEPSGSDLFCTNCPDPYVRPFEDGYYTLTLTDGRGCQIRDSVFIRVLKERHIYIPNAFSPNNDGLNDFFFVQSRNGVLIRSFRILSRWGELLFEEHDVNSNDPPQGWDGQFRGRAVPPGVYLYLVQIEFPDGVTKEFSGDLILMR